MERIAHRNRGFRYRSRVREEDDGSSLLELLGQRHTHSTPETWCRRIEAGQVEIESSTTRDSTTIVRRGQEIAWNRPGWLEPPAPLGFGTVFRDSDLLVVDKPSGLPTLPGGGFLESTLLHLVRERDPDAVPLHRLGRFTSGLVLFARTQAARRSLADQWRRGVVEKIYRARASGDPSRDRFEVTTPIGPVAHALLGTIHAAHPAGKPSLSIVRVLERRCGSFDCAVEIPTGRPHQIRIHLAAVGHPLVGDPIYRSGGLPAPDSRALPGDPGYALHAERLGFRHPTSREELTFLARVDESSPLWH